MSVLAAIAVLGILIVVHELGHFGAARLQGIHVTKFSIGFGPVLAKYQGKETEYALRAIPLGGYVAFPDDDPESKYPPNDPNLLRNRPLFDRAIVISAGVIANLIFAYLLLVGQVATVGVQDINYQPGVLIPEIIAQAESPAFVAGVKSGDVVVAVDNKSLPASEDSIDTLRNAIQASPNQPLKFTIKRGDKLINLNITPEAGESGKGKIGVMLSPYGEIIKRHPKGIGELFTVASQQFERYMSLTFQGFGQLITNFKESSQQVAGPVAIVAVGAELAKNDLGNLFQFGALISINLAIINILPLPALDGGQLAFLVFEGVMGKPLPNRLQEGIMQTGLVLLLGLGIFLILRDTANLAFFQELLPQ
jgi:membrane-associated protease RseP (regulator of RpoE activity)